MHPAISRLFSTYPFYDRLRYRRKIKQIARDNPTVFRQRLDRQTEREILRYWQAYGMRLNLTWHRAYAAVHPTDQPCRYVPEDIYYAYIERTLNRFDLAEAYTDKNNYDRLFPGVATPVVRLRRMNSRFYDSNYEALEPAEAVAILGRTPGQMIVKPSIASGGGLNVRKLRVEAGSIWLNEEKTDFATVAAIYGGDFLIQTVFEQHPAIAAFHPHSINTTRIYTYRLGNEINVASAVLRLGDGGRCVDNGGIPCGIGADGRLNDQAVTKYFHKHEVHPFTKKPFKNFQLPGWTQACELVRGLHQKLPYFDTVSWDIAIGRDAMPSLIEFNLCYQDVTFLQVNNGPLFGERTEEILARVFRRGPAIATNVSRGSLNSLGDPCDRGSASILVTDPNRSRYDHSP